MLRIFKKMEIEEQECFNEPSNKLVDNELPWGWIAYNNEFISKTEDEFNYFRTRWENAHNSGNPTETYGALKSLLKYMDDVQQLCNKKGECFGFWCSEYLINQKWKLKLISEMEDLENNMDSKITEHNNTIEREKQIKRFNQTFTDNMILKVIKENKGILQKDLYKLFDHPFAKEALSERLYFMTKEGKIKRTKSGNTYILEVRK